MSCLVEIFVRSLREIFHCILVTISENDIPVSSFQPAEVGSVTCGAASLK